MHTRKHIQNQLRGKWKPPTSHKARTQETHTNSSSKPPFFYVPTYSTHKKREAQNDFNHKLSGRLHFSLRWITNNTTTSFGEPSNGKSEVFLELCFVFLPFFFLSFCLSHNITYQSERVRVKRGADGKNLPNRLAAFLVLFSSLFFPFTYSLSPSVNSRGNDESLGSGHTCLMV